MTAVLVIALAAALSAQTDRPQSVRALMETARTQMRDGNASGALESLRQARAIAPNSEEVLSALAQVSLTARAITPAILTLESLVRICPTVAQHHHMLGVALIQASDLPAAVDSLRQAEQLDPGRGSTILALGVALNAQNNYSDARAALARAVELEPENMDGQAALAEAEEALGELDAAERRAGRVLAASKDHAAANLVLGMIRLKQGRHEEARDALLNAVMLNPTSPKAHYQLSLVYARLGDEASSEKHREVYQKMMREAEDRLRELRSQRGAPAPAR
jgi:tetratricopeptide (TPR) repeat protein